MVFDRKKVIFLVSGIAFAVVMAMLGILLLKADDLAPPQDVTLQFWGAFDQRGYYQSAIDEYAKLRPNVRIVYRELAFGEYEKTLVSALAAGTGPDIWLMHNTWLPRHQDKIAPLPQDLEDENGDRLLTFKDFQENFVDVTQADLIRKGEIYAMPLYVDTLALYYNKDLFNSQGITVPPRTWEDFVIQIEKLTRTDERGNITQSAAAMGTSRNINRSTDILMLLMLQSGAEMTNPSNTSATFSQSVSNLNVGELALTFYTDFANQAKPDRYTWNDFQKYSIDAFTDGNTAMMLNYSHHIKTIRAKAPRLNFGLAPAPQPEKAPFSVNFTNYWAPTVSKQSAAAEEAWRFLIYLGTTDAVKNYLDVSDRPAARKDIIETQKSVPELGIFAEQALSARSWFQADNVAIETIFAKMIDDVNFSRFSVPDALSRAEADVNVIMSKLGN